MPNLSLSLVMYAVASHVAFGTFGEYYWDNEVIFPPFFLISFFSFPVAKCCVVYPIIPAIVQIHKYFALFGAWIIELQCEKT